MSTKNKQRHEQKSKIFLGQPVPSSGHIYVYILNIDNNINI